VFFFNLTDFMFKVSSFFCIGADIISDLGLFLGQELSLPLSLHHLTTFVSVAPASMESRINNTNLYEAHSVTQVSVQGCVNKRSSLIVAQGSAASLAGLTTSIRSAANLAGTTTSTGSHLLLGGDGGALFSLCIFILSCGCGS